jgi:hypothetical protein
MMNFINMPRGLLDQVIEMSQVRYRLKGRAELKPSFEHMPSFPIRFDLTGNSPVIK